MHSCSTAGTTRPVNRAVDTTPATHRVVGCVHDGINALLDDVTEDRLDPVHADSRSLTKF